MRSKPWLAIALVISLSINLLILGFVVGRNMHRPAPMLGWMTEDVTPETRERIRERMRSHLRNTKETRRQLRDLRTELRTVVAEEPYDPAAVDALFTELRQASLKLQEETHSQISKNLEDMTPEERKFAFRWLIDRERRGGPRRKENLLPRE